MLMKLSNTRIIDCRQGVNSFKRHLFYRFKACGDGVLAYEVNYIKGKNAYAFY